MPFAVLSEEHGENKRVIIYLADSRVYCYTSLGLRPFGNLPRLILAWLYRFLEAVRTQSRVIVLGTSMAKFLKTLGVYTTSGETQTRLRNQMKRLFGYSG